MSNVTVDIKNREFLIACEDGKEEEVLELAKIFSERVSKLSERLNDLDHERLFLLAGILAEEDNKNLLKASGLDKAMNNIKKIAEKFDEID
ncbi:MAG: cell division protein ZapA [Pseudomonadota bacterium]|jgi:cell division protein ZapA (FtsZ GTPase activity inhibitor)|nr:cell division protein ZapA [Pseudomonadota bacterium]MEC9097833.1 cell division protein ZapA [Pseudomonadota bacterium]MED5254393.1 cell division protein ZapA [Pseudomonadota bacterium]MED5273232.1 cell division protein ZapA [Pseudomonadota bacterium]